MPSENDDLSHFIARIYAIAVEPYRLSELAEDWERQVGASGRRLGLLGDPTLAFHVEQADEMLRKVTARQDMSFDSISSSLQGLTSAAFVISLSGVVRAANAEASRLGVTGSMLVTSIPWETSEVSALSDAVKTVFDGKGSRQVIVALRELGGGRMAFARVSPLTGGFEEAYALVTTSDVALPPRLVELWRQTFALTKAETETLKSLAQGLTVRDIAEATGRSEATIRSHVKMLLSKTNARSQGDLVRALLGFVSTSPRDSTEDVATATGETRANPFRVCMLGDGRSIEYLEIGDPRGRPFLWLPKNYGIVRWPASAEAALATAGFRMISTVRAGYGRSSPIHAGESPLSNAADDLLELMDQLGVERCPWVTLGDDHIIAMMAARRAPGRVSTIIACGATMPANRPIHYQRMPPWPRFIRGNARYAPSVLPFLLRAGFGLAARLGGRDFMRAVLRSSPADLEALMEPEIAEALAISAEVVSSTGRTAIQAYAAELIESQRDWEPLLAKCETSITLFIGAQDPHTPQETVREYFAKYPQIRLIEFKDAGHLAFMTHWRELIAEIGSAAE